MTSFAGVDLARVKIELETFVSETRPKNASTANVITTTSYPQCGRSKAIELVERVRPILNALYSDWRSENPQSKSFEFQPERTRQCA